MRPTESVPSKAILVGAVLALASCGETGIALRGKVNVPHNVQRMFSAQHPGELVVRAQIAGRPDIVVPSMILCGSTAVEQVIDVNYVKQVCADDDNALISAWVIPRTALEVSCTVPPALPRPADTERSTSAIAFGRTVAPLNVTTQLPSGCRNGAISFALTLEPR